MSIGFSTKLYGFWIPNRKLFGDKIQAMRHVFTPTVNFSYAPDFGASSYGYWETYQKTDADGNVSLVSYSTYARTPSTVCQARVRAVTSRSPWATTWR